MTDRAKSTYLVPGSQCSLCGSTIISDGKHEWCGYEACGYGREAPRKFQLLKSDAHRTVILPVVNKNCNTRRDEPHGVDTEVASVPLRDWFAGQALPALLSDETTAQNMSPEELAEGAFRFADAMMSAREL